MVGPMRAQDSSTSGSLGDFWAGRPVRPQQGGKVAGVAAGIGRRYDVDPVLVRVVLVVLACYGGSGIVLYLLGWLLLPKEGAPEAQRTQPPSTTVLVLLGVLVAAVLLWTLRFPGWFGIAAGIGALYLLHRHRGDAGPHGESRPDDAESDTKSTVASAAVSSEGGSTEAGSTEGGSSESGLAAEADEPPARRWITLTTLAAAALAALVAGLAGVPVPAALAVALAVLGAGLVLGSFLRGGRALLLFAIPVGLIALVLGTHTSWARLPGTEHDSGADISQRPTAVDQLRPDYRSDSGDVHLDLSGLPGGAPARTNVTTGSGRIHVVVPRGADVLANCSSTSGDVECLGDNGGNAGSAHRSERVVDTGPDGPGGGSVQLDVRSRTGDVEVTRE